MDLRSMFARTISSLGAILILAAGCSDQGLTETSLRPQVAVLSKAHTSGTVSKIIGPSGGKLEFDIGSLEFPAGALSVDTEISATVNGQDLGVTFAPHGLVFPAGAQPVLAFNVGGVQIPAGASIFYLSDSGEALERYEIAFDRMSQTASTLLKHFSPYVLGVD